MKKITDHSKKNTNITCGCMKNIGLTYHEIDIYNDDLQYPLHKYFFLLKNLKIVHRHRSSLKIVLGNTQENTNFVEYVDDLENKIETYLKKNCNDESKTIFPKKTFKKEEYYPYTFEIDTTDMKVYTNSSLLDNNNTNSNVFSYIDDVYRNSEQIVKSDDVTISMILEISKVMFDNKNFWFVYSAKIMKIYDNRHDHNIIDFFMRSEMRDGKKMENYPIIETVNVQNNNIGEYTKNNDTPIIPMNIPIPPPCPQIIIPFNKFDDDKKKNDRVELHITEQMLQDQISKLSMKKKKTIENNSDNDSNNANNNNNNNIIDVDNIDTENIKKTLDTINFKKHSQITISNIEDKHEVKTKKKVKKHNLDKDTNKSTELTLE